MVLKKKGKVIVKFRKQLWKVLVPDPLYFSNNIIKNLLIERSGNKIITNIHAVKIIDNKEFFSIENYF
jgi:hypothetical protein